MLASGWKGEDSQRERLGLEGNGKKPRGGPYSPALGSKDPEVSWTGWKRHKAGPHISVWNEHRRGGSDAGQCRLRVRWNATTVTTQPCKAATRPEFLSSDEDAEDRHTSDRETALG